MPVRAIGRTNEGITSRRATAASVQEGGADAAWEAAPPADNAPSVPAGAPWPIRPGIISAKGHFPAPSLLIASAAPPGAGEADAEGDAAAAEWAPGAAPAPAAAPSAAGWIFTPSDETTWASYGLVSIAISYPQAAQE